MRNGAHVSVVAAAFEARPFTVAIAVVAVCAVLVGLAFSLPGRAPEGVVLGIGTTVASMLSVAHPRQALAPLATYALTAAVGASIAFANSPAREPRASTGSRVRSGVRALRLGGFWLGVPTAAVAAMDAQTGVAGDLDLVASLGVFVLVVAAARRRGRDLSVGYVAGALVGLAGLVASAYGQAAGSGAVLAYPAGPTGLVALGCAARIGLDRTFATWQRLTAVSVGAATLVAVSSAVAFTAATAGCAAYVVFRLRGVRMPRQLRERPVTSAFGAVAPFVTLAGLWLASLMSLPRDRARTTDFTHLAAFGKTGAAGKLFGYTPVTTFIATGWLGMATLIAGAALVVWRVTGPGLPLWVPVLGLAMLAGVLAGGSGSAYGPSPAWVLLLGAELWVFCHGLRPDRDVIPPPRLPEDG